MANIKNSEMKEFVSAIFIAIAIGNESRLRKTPIGRNFLLHLAIEQRKKPLETRRATKIATQKITQELDGELIDIMNNKY